MLARKDAVRDALEFIRPYYTGEKKHIEFVCSKIPSDLKGKADGVEQYQNRPWDPKKARTLLRLALPVFPEIQSWAGTAKSVDGAEYQPWVKAVAALR